MKKTQKTILFAVLIAAAHLPLCSAQAASNRSALLPDVGIDQQIGTELPADIQLQDETGKTVTLGSFFKGKPVIITPVYYTCPMLCTLVLNGLVKALKDLSFTPGEDFEIVSFSFKPEDRPEMAAAKKKNYLESYGREGAEQGWHFLTADQKNIDRLTKALGFHYHYDEKTGEYAHGAAIMVATPQGKLSHYFFGVAFNPKDLRLALVEASKSELGTLADQVLLLCYHYDPTTGKYGFAIMNALRAGGLITVLAIIAFITSSLRKDSTQRMHR